MSTTNIKLKRSSVADKIPTTGQLELGELAINTNDGKIFLKKDDGTARIRQVVMAGNQVASLTTTTQTAIASFSTTTYGGGKFVIQAYDSVAGDRHITELLVTHDGTTAIATEYGTVHTSTEALATYDVDVNSGNFRILATGASTNTTVYTILENLMME